MPWDIDRTFWEVMCVDHGRLLRNLVAWTANEPPPVEVEGPGVAGRDDLAAARSMTVHLVNLTNPMMMKGPRARDPAGRIAARPRADAARASSQAGPATHRGYPAGVRRNGRRRHR